MKFTRIGENMYMMEGENDRAYLGRDFCGTWSFSTGYGSDPVKGPYASLEHARRVCARDMAKAEKRVEEWFSGK